MSLPLSLAPNPTPRRRRRYKQNPKYYITMSGSSGDASAGAERDSASTLSYVKASRSLKLESASRSLDDFLTEASLSWRSRIDEEDANTILCRVTTPLAYTMIFVSLGVANSSDASEILCLAYILSEGDFQSRILLHSPWRASLLAAAVFLGMLVGGLIVGALGDTQGRRKLLLWGLAVNFTTGLLSAGATNLWILSSLRLLAGIGIGATVPPLFTLCSELALPADRGFWVTLAASFWMIGSIYVAICGWIVLAWMGLSWRVLAAACALPSGIGFLLVARHVPESPRFLALQGRYEAALQSSRQLAHAMRYNGDMISKSELLVFYPLAQVTSSSISLRNSFHQFVRTASLLYLPSLVQTTLNLQLIWFVLSFGSYGLLTWINTLFEEVHLQNVYTNALLFAFANLPGNVISALLMDRGSGGRARLLTGSLLAASVSLVLFALAAVQPALGRGTIVGAACIFQACTVAAWNAVDVLSTELFPTQVRATGMGLCAASGRLGAMIAQGVNGFLVGSPARLLLVASLSLLVGAVAPKWLADATGQPIQDRVYPTGAQSTEADGLHLSERSTDTPPRGSEGLPRDRGYSYQQVDANDDGLDNSASGP